MTLSIARPTSGQRASSNATITSSPARAGAEQHRSAAVVVPAPVLLVSVYIMAMPFLAGLARGTVVPLLRPSEVLQLAVTVAGAGLWVAAACRGRRTEINLRTSEWWLLAVAVTSSVLPALWLLARGMPLGGEELLATFPFVKYAMLYFLVRASVSSTDHLELLSAVVVGTAMALTAVAVGQALGVGPVVDVIGRFYADGAETVVDEGRGTTTLGSSIATGALLSFATGLALSWGLATGRKVWLLAAVVLSLGTVASGQVGSIIALGVVVLTVANGHRRTGQLLRWGLPAGALAAIGLWPVVAARLASIDQGTGLPSSWIIRWNNVSELYLPSLFDGGWLLGVSPDAILAPPDVFRETVYLESGYLLLLWVGGLPLLIAGIGFLVSTWRALDAAPDLDLLTGAEGASARNPVAVAAIGATAMMVLLSIIDPHLSLRGGADLFYILVAFGLAATPLATPSTATAPAIKALLTTSEPTSERFAAIRVNLTEGTAAANLDGVTALRLAARFDGTETDHLTMHITGNRRLTATVHPPLPATADRTGTEDLEAAAVLWRSVMLIADSLRIEELRINPGGADRSELGEVAAVAMVLDRKQTGRAAELARSEEQRRTERRHRVNRADRGAEAGDPAEVWQLGAALPALRLEPVRSLPLWKRTVDVVVGSVVLAATSPLLVLCAVLVKRSGEGPVLYRQIRIGTGGLPFRILKFRTMYVNNDDSAHREQNRREILENAEASKDDADPRITPIGRFLRRTSLDELPQLVNVLRSEMSLVGPRPSLLWETELFASPARRRLHSRPGITGLWQVSGRADLSMSEMLELDVEYVDRMSPGLDLQCLAKTATSVVAGEGAR